MVSDAERFKASCTVAGNTVPRGATEKQLEAFEQKYDVGLPADMRAFYSFMNGGGPNHETVFYFWPLDEIRRTAVDNKPDWFIFADHSVSVFEYALQLTVDGTGPNEVYCPELERLVAVSFTDFLARCLEDPGSLW
jgi:SMI1 / KNR4 family (SUKH-1)